MLLLFVWLTLVLLFTLPWLFEPGPVVPMFTLPPLGTAPVKALALLLTLTLLFVLLALPALPVEALPPLVLPDTLALPLEAP